MIRTLIVLAVVTVLPLAPAEQTAVVPLAQDLVFTTTSHSALVAGDRSLPVADTEVVYSIETADADRIQFTFSFSAPGDAATASALDAVPHRIERTVRREDFRSATRMSVLVSSADSAMVPGQTFAGTSEAVVRALHESGTTGFVLGVNEPDAGLEALGQLVGAAKPASTGAPLVASGVSVLLSALSASRHYYRGALTRVGTGTEPFSVLLDGRRTTVPAVHARGDPHVRQPSHRSGVLVARRPEQRSDAQVGGGRDLRSGDADYTAGRARQPKSWCRRRGADRHQLSCGTERRVFHHRKRKRRWTRSLPALEALAGVLREHADWRVTIEGHTDNIGSADYNLDLSTRRTAAVKDVLIRRFSVPEAGLRTKGYGLTRPIETNATDEGRAHNRRVEVSRDVIPDPEAARAPCWRRY